MSGKKKRQEYLSQRRVYSLALMVGLCVTRAIIAKWSQEERAEWCKWAFKLHLKAGDNPVRVPKRPAFYIEPTRKHKYFRI